MIGPSLFAVIGFVSLVTVGAGYPRNHTTIVNDTGSSLESIEQEAHGRLFNASLPLSVSKDSVTSLQLIAFTELFEVAFFEQLLFNLTNHVDGFELNSSPSGSFVIDTILAVQNVSVSDVGGSLSLILSSKRCSTHYTQTNYCSGLVQTPYNGVTTRFPFLPWTMPLNLLRCSQVSILAQCRK